MTIRFPTGSGLGRAIACPASCALPGAKSTSAASVQGSATHRAIELAITSGNFDALPDVARECIGDGEVIAVERTYALDIVRGKARHLGDRLERDYSGRNEGEVCLTIDLVTRSANGRVRVTDWKSRERVTAVRDNWQMRGAAMAALMVEGSKDGVADAVLAYLDDGETDQAEVDAFDAADWWEQLYGFYEKLCGEPTADIHEGPWCKYCDAAPFCPAKTRLAVAMIGELTGIEGSILEMTAEQAGRAWDKAKDVEALLDRVQKALRERAKREPLPLANGRRLALVESSRTSLDTKAAKELLEQHGIAVPMKHSEFTMTKEIKAS